MFDFFNKSFLIINCTLFFDDIQHKLTILIDIDVIEYVFINKEITQFIYNMIKHKICIIIKIEIFY